MAVTLKIDGDPAGGFIGEVHDGSAQTIHQPKSGSMIEALMEMIFSHFGKPENSQAFVNMVQTQLATPTDAGTIDQTVTVDQTTAEATTTATDPAPATDETEPTPPAATDEAHPEEDQQH